MHHWRHSTQPNAFQTKQGDWKKIFTWKRSLEMWHIVLFDFITLLYVISWAQFSIEYGFVGRRLSVVIRSRLRVKSRECSSEFITSFQILGFRRMLQDNARKLLTKSNIMLMWQRINTCPQSQRSDSSPWQHIGGKNSSYDVHCALAMPFFIFGFLFFSVCLPVRLFWEKEMFYVPTFFQLCTVFLFGHFIWGLCEM